jgi:hypothetical protein
MSEDTSLKTVLGLYYFVLSFIFFYGADIIVQHLVYQNIDWTKYISNAFSHALMIAAGSVFGWGACKDWHEGEH